MPGSTVGGEYEVTARIYRDLSNEWQCECSLGGAVSTSISLTDDQRAAIENAQGWSQEGVGKTTIAGEVDEPLILLRRLMRYEHDGIVDANSKDFGLLIWTECTP